ncbi:vanadium-dependent haloperoxidase [Streptomyces sp. CC224B]|uniref:vanadium-dependent haloperoxidase n=1 Tax=Streptomyces sp. CC224B TaxID=3044571 RepID=UPI0024A97021|nr:vanadium-dependent haloperoxidase [Streptomyces sp. CC224B]
MHGRTARRREPARRGHRRRIAALTVALAAAVGTLVAAPAPAAAAPNFDGDPIHYWNGVLQQAMRTRGGAPGPLARAAAMLNGAMYDAESSYRLRWHRMTSEPYLEAYRYDAILEGPAEEERVIGRTAYKILLGIFKEQKPYLDQKFTDRFGTRPDEFDLLDHTVVNKVVARMESARAADGFDDQRKYTGDKVPGAWRPTHYADLPDPSCAQESQAATPYWGEVKPFAIPTGSEYRPPTPDLYGTYDRLLASTAYRDQVDKVRRAGAANAPESERSRDQTAAAWFWANDANGTYKPPGQILQHTREVATAQRLTTYQNARLFALVSLAMADASIAEWDVKYRTPIDLWRPVSAIRDGGLDRGWKPLAGTTPCFPAWASGHASFAGAWAGVLEQYFGTGDIAVTLTTDEPKSPVKSRSFTSFRQAARENADSRIYLGVHYPWDATDGLAVGDKVADYVTTNKLKPIP